MNNNKHEALFNALGLAESSHAKETSFTHHESAYIARPGQRLGLIIQHGLDITTEKGHTLAIATLLKNSCRDNPTEVTTKSIKAVFGKLVAVLVQEVCEPYSGELEKASTDAHIIFSADILGQTMNVIKEIKEKGLKEVEGLMFQGIHGRSSGHRKILEDIRIAYAARAFRSSLLSSLLASAEKAIDELLALAA